MPLFRSIVNIYGRRSFHKTGIEPVDLAALNFVNQNNRKPPLIIVHGLFGHKQNWSSLGKALERKLDSSVHCVDLRNHGTSPRAKTMTFREMAADLAKFVSKIRDASGHEHVNLLGHSLGGKVVMEMALDEQSRESISRIIVEDVSPKGYSSKINQMKGYSKAMNDVDLSRSRQQIFRDLEKPILQTEIRQFLLTNLQTSKADPSKFEWKCDLEGISNNLDDLISGQLSGGSFEGPSLFLYGTLSDYLPKSHWPDVRSMFPKARFEGIVGAGHWVHVDHPSDFLQNVTEFLSN